MKDMSTDGIEVTAVPAAVVDVVWDDVAPMIEKATKTSGGRYDVSSVREGIESGVLALWIAMDDAKPIAALTTRVEVFPTGMRVLAIDWIGGKRMKDWLPEAHAVLSDYGRAYGCQHLQGYGRKGWLRALSKHGWGVDYTAYRMEIDNG